VAFRPRQAVAPVRPARRDAATISGAAVLTTDIEVSSPARGRVTRW